MGALFLMRTSMLHARLIRFANTTGARNTLMHPISKLLCETYSELHKNGQVSFPLQEAQKHRLDAVVKTVNASYFGIERFPTVEERAAAYLCHIIKGHCVTDGNKRLAVLWFTVYCAVNNLKPNTRFASLDELAVAIEQEKELSLSQIISMVKTILFPTHK